METFTIEEWIILENLIKRGVREFRDYLLVSSGNLNDEYFKEIVVIEAKISKTIDNMQGNKTNE